MMVGAISDGVLFALPLTLAVRATCLATGSNLSESVAGTLFLAFALATGAIVVNVYARYLTFGSPAAALTTSSSAHEKSQPCITA